MEPIENQIYSIYLYIIARREGLSGTHTFIANYFKKKEKKAKEDKNKNGYEDKDQDKANHSARVNTGLKLCKLEKAGYIKEREKNSRKNRPLAINWSKIIEDFIKILLEKKEQYVLAYYMAEETPVKKRDAQINPIFYLDNPQFIKNLKKNKYFVGFLRECFISLSSEQNHPTISEFLEYVSTRHFLIQESPKLDFKSNPLSKTKIEKLYYCHYPYNPPNREYVPGFISTKIPYHYSIDTKSQFVSCFNIINIDYSSYIKKEFREEYKVFCEILPRIIIKLNENPKIESIFPLFTEGDTWE